MLVKKQSLLLKLLQKIPEKKGLSLSKISKPFAFKKAITKDARICKRVCPAIIFANKRRLKLKVLN
jgi:hypothetical protein